MNVRATCRKCGVSWIFSWSGKWGIPSCPICRRKKYIKLEVIA